MSKMRNMLLSIWKLKQESQEKRKSKELFGKKKAEQTNSFPKPQKNK